MICGVWKQLTSCLLAMQPATPPCSLNWMSACILSRVKVMFSCYADLR